MQKLFGTDTPVLLAPMAGVTDAAFRGICREMGADFSYTEMVSAKGLHYNNKNTATLLDASPPELSGGYGVQLFGAEPEMVARAAKMLSETQSGLKLIDINMGCPAHKIVSNGEGSALMKNEPLAARIIEAAVKASALPVTVKFRKGWDEEHVNALSFARMAEESGAAMITIHGRTREQMYIPPIDTAAIAAVEQAVSIPVLANGDVTDADGAVALLKATGCDGVMIGRGALGDPWLFEQVRAAILGEERPPEPTLNQRMSALRAQIYEMCEERASGPPCRRPAARPCTI